MSRLALVACAAVLLSAPVARANEGYIASITLSPLHLIMPMGEVTAEFRIIDKLGIAAVFGAGTFIYTDVTPPTVLEAGASLRYYVVGDFEHGMQLGAEVLYAHVATSTSEGDVTVTGVGSGLAVGPFIGYKIATRVGFTFDSQVGVTFAAVDAEASGGGQSASQSASLVGLLLNLNIGWSF